MKRRSKTIAQQCRYYEVDNIFEYYGIGLPQRKHIRLWGTIQGTQSEGQKGIYTLSLFRS